MNMNIRALHNELTKLGYVKIYVENLLAHAVLKNKKGAKDFQVEKCVAEFEEFHKMVETLVLKSAIEYGPAEILGTSFIFTSAEQGDEFWWNIFDSFYVE
jgi:hypothetical protein